jgi:F420-non-reducing hydrogenase iron-sulfur subunit
VRRAGGDFRPHIVSFLCHWCAYAGADLAGTSRIEYPPTILPIRVMCSGRVDPSFVIQALADGADGVLIVGCHPGQCHYGGGNYDAMRRRSLLARLLRQLNLEPERVRLAWVSASEGEKFAQLVEQMTKQILKLGPNPLKRG